MRHNNYYFGTRPEPKRTPEESPFRQQDEPAVTLVHTASQEYFRDMNKQKGRLVEQEPALCE